MEFNCGKFEWLRYSGIPEQEQSPIQKKNGGTDVDATNMFTSTGSP